MIKNVKFSNFYSFNQEQEISFVAKKKNTHDYFQSNSGDQITKIASFIGGNASGKTNIMRVFSFLSYFVCVDNKNDSSDSDIVYKTFFNNKKPSKFDIEFELEDYLFFYNFCIQENKIIEENLSVKIIKKNSKKVKLFCRELNNVTSLNKDYFKNFPKDSKEFLKNIRPDVSLIAFLKAHYSIDIINLIYVYFSKFSTNINERGEINNFATQIKSLEMYLEDSELKKEMENFIRHFDIGLDGFEIKKEIKDKKVSISVQGVHKTQEENNKLDFIYESKGTQSLFFTLANILNSLKNNSIVIIDEIESGFHPEALNKIISYFIDENKDKKSQIIFSSHSLGFMNKLDMHQIYLVKKDEESASLVYRLNQVEGVRPDENFLAKYMAGSYGAFPKIKV